MKKILYEFLHTKSKNIFFYLFFFFTTCFPTVIPPDNNPRYGRNGVTFSTKNFTSLLNKMGKKTSKSEEKLTINSYPPINYKKIKKSGFRIGAHIDFETGMTFGKNHVSEMFYSENNQHFKLFEKMKQKMK